jgi:hypothetical protein
MASRRRVIDDRSVLTMTVRNRLSSSDLIALDICSGP